MGKAVKTEHAGAKNGGGMWCKRAVAKERANSVRRRDDKTAVGDPDETCVDQIAYDASVASELCRAPFDDGVMCTTCHRPAGHEGEHR